MRANSAWLGRAALLLLLGVGACRQSAAPLVLPAPRLTATPEVAAPGQPVAFSWAGDGAEACTLATGVRVLEPDCRSGRATETYPAPGSYPVVLELRAGGVTLTDEATVTVTGDEPTKDPIAETPDEPTFTARADPGDGLSLTFTAARAPADASFAWRFGDGTQGAGAQVKHRYRRAGTYEVTLEVKGRAGTQGTRQTLQVQSEVKNERIVLFDGGDLSAWRLRRGGAPNWRLGDGFAEVVSGERVAQNDLQTRGEFGDFRLHLEFRVPETAAGLPEQARGNSGVYLQGRYEVQILDSFGRSLSGKNDAGAIYSVADAAINASRPAGSWQSYEIIFRAARFSGGRKTADARVTVFWNGRKVQDDTRIPGPTRLGAPERGDGVLTGPIVLQDHGNPVQYRNIWLERR